MAKTEEKTLVWDGLYDTVAPDQNAQNVDPGNATVVPTTEWIQVGLGETFHVINSGVSVRLVSVTREFVPMQSKADLRVKLKRITNIGWLALRIYDKVDDLVYQEVLKGKQIAQLPPGSTSPGQKPRARLYPWSAHKDDGPFTFRVWVGKSSAPALGSVREVKADVPAIVTDLNATAPKVHTGLGLTVSSTAAIRKKYLGWRIDDRKGTSKGYHIVSRTPTGTLTVQTILEPTEQRGTAVHDQSGKAWGKAEVGKDPNKRAVDKNEVGLNQTNAKRPHVRVISYQVPVFSAAPKGTTFALTEAIGAIPPAPRPMQPWTLAQRRRFGLQDVYATVPEGHKLFEGSLTADPLKAKQKEDVSFLKDALAKSEHLFSSVAAGKARVTGDGADVLKVFMAPEFFFTHPDRPYTKNEAYAILDDLRARSEKYPDWLFLPGTIWFADRHYQEAVRTDIDPKTNQPVTRKTFGTDGTAKDKTKVEDNYAKVVHNVAPVIMNGRILLTYLKVMPSTVDGLRAYNDTVKDAEKVAVDLNAGTPVALKAETWDRWVDVVKATLSKTEEHGFFVLNGISFGIEVCLDHCYGFLRETYETMFPGGNGVDVHLVVACGMPHDEPKICLHKVPPSAGKPVCGERNAATAATCKACNGDFAHLKCPSCGAGNAATAATCGACNWNFLDHACPFCVNDATATNCKWCNRRLGTHPSFFPADYWFCAGCNAASPKGTATCACGADLSKPFYCSECAAPNLATALVCAKAACGHDFKECPDCGAIGSTTTGPCGGCGNELALRPAYVEESFRRCVKCNHYSKTTAAACESGPCASDFTKDLCLMCSKSLASGATACTHAPCTWTDRTCTMCPKKRNLATDAKCTRCNGDYKPGPSFRIDHGNIQNIVARKGGYYLRNDGGYPSPDYAEATKIDRTGDVASKQITKTGLTKKAIAFEDKAFNAVSQNLQTVWAAHWRAIMEDRFTPDAFGLDDNRVTALCTTKPIPLSLFNAAAIRAMKLKDIPQPNRDEIWAAAEIQSSFTNWTRPTVDSVVVFDLINDL